MGTRISPTAARRLRPVAAVAAAALVAASLVAAASVSADAAKGHHHVAKAENGRIAFVRGGRIYTATASGGDVTRLTPGKGNQRPHYSPDGTRISFLHRSGTSWDVWVMNADGSNKKQVTHIGNATEAQWSPNGNWLAFGPTLSKINSTPPFGDPIPILGDLGDGPEELSVDTSLAWSPDGNIAYYSHQFPDSPDNYMLVLDMSTGSVIEWAAVGGSCCGEGFFGNPAWSPDGSELAYEALVYSPENGEHRTRPVIWVDAFPSGPLPGYPERRGNKDPEFSPDGKKLLLANVIKGRVSIRVTDIDGSNVQQITRGYQPDWQPVGSTT